MDVLELFFIDALFSRRWPEAVAAISSTVLALTAIVGAWIAFNIPQRISERETDIKRREREDTSRAVYMVLIKEMESTGRRLRAVKGVIDRNRRSDQLRGRGPLGADPEIENPLHTFKYSASYKPDLLSNPQHWLRFVSEEVTERLVDVSSRLDNWRSTLEAFLTRENVTKDELSAISDALGNCAKSADEALRVLQQE
jgi:hypothetical protein